MQKWKARGRRLEARREAYRKFMNSHCADFAKSGRMKSGGYKMPGSRTR